VFGGEDGGTLAPRSKNGNEHRRINAGCRTKEKARPGMPDIKGGKEGGNSGRNGNVWKAGRKYSKNCETELNNTVDKQTSTAGKRPGQEGGGKNRPQGSASAGA